MAERRMFARTIIDSDAFLDLPASAQALYFHLGMRADDDGFINNPKMIMRVIRASEDDLTLLIVKKFIIPFENGIVVIKHWKINNYIQNDRYNPTKYKELLKMLTLDENKAYTTPKNGDVSKMYTQVSIGKVSIGKNSSTREGETLPALDDIKLFLKSEKILIEEKEESFITDASVYFNNRQACGWKKSGGAPIMDWKSDLIEWELRERRFKAENNNKQGSNKPDVKIDWLDQYIETQ